MKDTLCGSYNRQQNTTSTQRTKKKLWQLELNWQRNKKTNEKSYKMAIKGSRHNEYLNKCIYKYLQKNIRPKHNMEQKNTKRDLI